MSEKEFVFWVLFFHNCLIVFDVQVIVLYATLGHPSAEMQSVYSTAPADSTFRLVVYFLTHNYKNLNFLEKIQFSYNDKNVLNLFYRLKKEIN